jgi:hypothetical protein
MPYRNHTYLDKECMNSNLKSGFVEFGKINKSCYSWFFNRPKKLPYFYDIFTQDTQVRYKHRQGNLVNHLGIKLVTR